MTSFHARWHRAAICKTSPTRGANVAASGSGKSTYARKLIDYLLSVDYFSGLVVLHGPPTCTRVWTYLAERVITKRLTEEQLNSWYTQAVEYNKQQGKRTLFVLDDPSSSGLGSKSEALNLVAMSGREWGISLLIIMHKLADTVMPEIRGTLDYVITGALNKATATHIVNDTTIGLDISVAGFASTARRAVKASVRGSVCAQHAAPAGVCQR